VTESELGGAPPTDVGASAPPESAGARPTTRELFVAFLVIGASAFGMAMLQSIRSVPVRRGWLAREEIDEGFGLVQLYPGALMVDLVAYIGYRMRRVRGALAAVVGFIAPSLVLLLVLSWAYFTYGSHPEVRRLVVGLDALVVGVLISVAMDFGKEHARGTIEALLALGAFSVGVAGENVLWPVLAGFVIGAFAWRSPDSAVVSGAGPLPATTEDHRSTTSVGVGGISWVRLVWAAVPGVAVIGAATVAAAMTGAVAAVAADMAKIGAVAFGNGTAIMPILQQDALAHHWLTLSQFGAGVGFGQVTPGPFLSTAAFVGFGAAGWWGGVLAGVAIYAPSVAMTMIVAELYPFLRRISFVRGAIRGVMAAFTGLLASMVLVLARPVLSVPAAVGFAAAGFVAVRTMRWPTIVVFAGGLAAWAVYLAAGGTA
jgi:chromate transporter